MKEMVRKIVTGLGNKYVLISALTSLVIAFVFSGAYRKAADLITTKVALYLIGAGSEPVRIEVVKGVEASEENQAGLVAPQAIVRQVQETVTSEMKENSQEQVKGLEPREIVTDPESANLLLAKGEEQEKKESVHQEFQEKTDTSGATFSYQPNSPSLEGLGQPTKSYTQQIQAYKATYLRDPFYSLVKAESEKPSKLLDVSKAKMVGAVWGESGIIALLEDERGRSYALREGDRVLNGRVSKVTPTSINFVLTIFGMTRQVTLEIAEEGEW